MTYLAPRDLAWIARNLRPGEQLMSGPNYQVQAELRRLVRRHEVSVRSPLVPDDKGTVYVIVRRHRAPVPAWRKPALIVAGAVSTVAGAGMLVAALVREIKGAVSQSGPALGFLIAFALVGLIAAKVSRGRQSGAPARR